MIPKKIHYCWFGRGEKPKLAKKCIKSWKKCCPDYEIIEWNEENFNISAYPYAKYCYDNKKWAFLSDFVRLVVVYEHGGIYFDTDVETVKSFDALLEHSAFFGFENSEHVASGLGFGAVPKHSSIKAMMDEYFALEPDSEGSFPIIGCPILNTKALVSLGMKQNGEYQMIDDIAVLPIDYMNPYDDPTGRLNKTENTYSIHWYSKSWLSKKAIFRSKLTKPFHRIFGNNCFDWLKK